MRKLSLIEFLDTIASKTDDSFGRQFRTLFADNRGTAELGMLASPSSDEISQLRTAVAIMTADELADAESLTDEQVRRIADDADIEAGILAIFLNGYALHCRQF